MTKSKESLSMEILVDSFVIKKKLVSPQNQIVLAADVANRNKTFLLKS